MPASSILILSIMKTDDELLTPSTAGCSSPRTIPVGGPLKAQQVTF